MTTEACLAVLDGTIANVNATAFDGGNGSVYAVPAPDCWTSVEAEIENDIALAGDAVQALLDLHLPTTVATDAIDSISSGRDYTDSLMIYTSW